MKIDILLILSFAILASVNSLSSSENGVGYYTIATGPTNVAVYANVATRLMCCASDSLATLGNKTRLQWWEFATRHTGNVISDGPMLLMMHYNFNRYRLGVSDQCYELTITPTLVNDGSVFMCYDFYADPPAIKQRGAQLVVIEAEPQLFNPLGENDAVEGVTYDMLCTVNFGATYPIAPLLTWTGPAPFTVQETRNNGSVSSTITFTANRANDGQAFTCKTNFTSAGFLATDMANNVPTWQHTNTSEPVYVKWVPSNMYITPNNSNVPIGANLTCHSDANPIASYLWSSTAGGAAGSFWPTQSIVMTPEMAGPNALHCRASNTINGAERMTTLDHNVFVDFFDACASSPCVAGSCVNVGNGYRCDCYPGFTGINCESTLDYCASFPCGNGGTCFNGPNYYFCACRPGFTGVHCETGPDPPPL